MILSVVSAIRTAVINLDTKWVRSEWGVGCIEDKHYIPPAFIYLPPEWFITVNLRGIKRSFSVEHDFYDSVMPGDRVQIEYVRGRFSDHVHLKGVGQVLPADRSDHVWL